ncbi:MAG: hypothetical protein PHE83_14735 [Opitutaceae bacterium]|nr:hypothetical protein [Opitutaceae bacterium]
MKHYLHGRSQLSETALKPPSPPAGALRIAPLETDSVGPNVEVVKQGDRVTRLIVTCACGERVEIECLYSAAG